MVWGGAGLKRGPGAGRVASRNFVQGVPLISTWYGTGKVMLPRSYPTRTYVHQTSLGSLEQSMLEAVGASRVPEPAPEGGGW